jgi:hypothetical protein
VQRIALKSEERTSELKKEETEAEQEETQRYNFI